MKGNFTKLGVQLREIWGQLGASQKVSVTLATLVVLGGIGGLALWSSRVPFSLLYGRLSDTEAAKVIAALDEAKVAYRVSGGSILVPEEKVHVMRLQLAGRGIPRGDGVGFEIFDKPNFGISDFVQRANYTRAVQGELARTIGQMDEIDSARVMIVLPENRLLLDRDKHPTASVFVRIRGNVSLSPQAINSIRFLVANAVEGLKPNFVSIVDNLGNTLSENAADDSMIGLTTTQLAARRNLEQYLAKKAESMLETLLGSGQAIVRVAAEIDFDSSHSTEDRYDPEGQVVRSQTKDLQTEDTIAATSSGVVGIATNTGTSTNATSVARPDVNTRTTKTTEDVQYELTKTVSTLVQASGGIKRLSAAVTVASRYEGTGATRKLISRTPEELEKLRRMVQSALGIQIGPGGRNDQITLEEMPFNDQVSVEVTQQLDQEQQREFWWTLGQKAIYPVLALGVIFFFWRLLKRQPLEEVTLGVPVRHLHLNGRNGGNGNGHGRPVPGQAMEPQAGMVTVEVLNQLIKENPTNMTQAIRGWLAGGKGNSR